MQRHRSALSLDHLAAALARARASVGPASCALPRHGAAPWSAPQAPTPGRPPPVPLGPGPVAPQLEGQVKTAAACVGESVAVVERRLFEEVASELGGGKGQPIKSQRRQQIQPLSLKKPPISSLLSPSVLGFGPHVAA